MDNTEIESIVPYTDEEAVKALREIALHPYVFVISRFIFPKESPFYLSGLLKKVTSIDDFQETIMSKVVDWCIDTTTCGLTVEGLENLRGIDGKFVLMSNHRDIILDPAIMNNVLLKNNIPMTQICVGSNLLSGGKVVEALLRSNRMIKVIRGISARDLYLSSQMLSKYIRETVTSGSSSIWIAQRQGRTKNGIDTTEQGLLKMLDMSGTKSFTENFSEINLVPMSISYEHEPCDGRKASEIVLSRKGPYVKAKNEDLHSIIIGIRQRKGRVHLHFGKPISLEEIEKASLCAKNDRYQEIRHVMDRHIIEGYKLWETNYIAYDLMTGTTKYADRYTQVQKEDFLAYIDHRMTNVDKEVDRAELRQVLYEIYGNPVISREKLDAGELD